MVMGATAYTTGFSYTYEVKGKQVPFLQDRSKLVSFKLADREKMC